MKTESFRFEVGSPEWLAFRKTGIGASEVGSVLGVCPWRSQVDVWLEKTGKAEPFAGNNATYAGQLLEDLIAKEYSLRTGYSVRKLNYTLRRGILIGDVDRLCHTSGTLPAFKDDIRTDRALEAKSARDRYLWADGVPLYYEAQCLTYMHLADSIQTVDLGVFFRTEAEFDFSMSVSRDQQAINDIAELCEGWWQKHIVEGSAPEPTSEDDCKRLWGKHRPETVCLSTPEIEAALARIADAKARAKQAEADEAEAKTLVMSAMQDREVLKSPDGKVLATWKAAKDSQKTDWQAVAVEAGAGPELIKKHTNNVAGSRRFLPKNGK